VVPTLIPLILALATMIGSSEGAGEPAPDLSPDDPFSLLRSEMVRKQIEARGVEDVAVLQAMRRVPRHCFVPASLLGQAYDDHALPIGEGQTISQPYIVGLMTELLAPEPDDRVLEIGTGSGYQAAVLAELCCEVYSIEILPALGRRAATLLEELGYADVHLHIGDGYRGWPEAAPFDGILVTAAPDHVPQPLLAQLAPGGRLVIPVGEGPQWLEVHTRGPDDAAGNAVFEYEVKIAVRFVPMTGEARRRLSDG
jgi:protein-L-isoaspartate(D-aspartate) O-methyltransferase